MLKFAKNILLTMKMTFSEDLRYFSQKKNRYGENRLRSDSIMEYPCTALAALFSPKAYYGWKLSDIKKEIKAKVIQLLRENPLTQSLPQRNRGNAKHILTMMQLLDGEVVEVTEDLYLPANAVDVMVDVATQFSLFEGWRLEGAIQYSTYIRRRSQICLDISLLKQPISAIPLSAGIIQSCGFYQFCCHLPY